MMQAHRAAATDIKSKEICCNKRVELLFPNGITCKWDHFSNQKGKLKNNVRMMKVVVANKDLGSKVTQLVLFLFWKF
jgi:hypothetical protein